MKVAPADEQCTARQLAGPGYDSQRAPARRQHDVGNDVRSSVAGLPQADHLSHRETTG